MKPRVLLVNPPVYDFSAYDFWLKPYGLLSAGGMLRKCACVKLFDFMDRLNPRLGPQTAKSDPFGRGPFRQEDALKPAVFSSIPRVYRRFGMSRESFRAFLSQTADFDLVLLNSAMTYWYPGLVEVIDDVRKKMPHAKILLGGIYATLCPDHASTLGADMVCPAGEWQAACQGLGLTPEEGAMPFWEGYPALGYGVIKLAHGCPMRCTYCSSSRLHPVFSPRPAEEAWAETLHLCRERGVRDIAFYDDALLFESGRVLVPFLERVINAGLRVRFHTPNAVHARFIDESAAGLMARAGFKKIYIGYESASDGWQSRTGGKTSRGEFETAVTLLARAGIDRRDISAYMLVGHPRSQDQEVEASMRLANGLGVRVMLSEFSPIPGTPDALHCEKQIDMREPLLHNKTAFAFLSMGGDRIRALKDLCRSLNQTLPAAP